MEKETNSSGPDFQNESNPPAQPTTQQVKEINEFTFKQYAKKWAYVNSFFPVLRLIENDKIFIKIYYDVELRDDIRQLEEFSATFYRENIANLNYSECNVLRIRVENKINTEEILNCNSMEELELLYSKSFGDDEFFGVLPHAMVGSVNVHMKWVDREFKYWNKLLSEGYLTDEYEKKCKDLNEQIFKSTISQPTEEKKHSLSIHIFHKTGGEQPMSLDPKAVNHFFKGNYAKDWAMRLGYIPTFKDYKDGVIHFDIISDPRCKEHDFFLAHYIAGEYSKRLTLLKDAKSFIANHFKANDIIGFLITREDEHLLQSMKVRMDKSYADLPKTPELVHYGTVVKSGK